MSYLADYSLFLAEIATAVVAILLLVAGLVAILSKNRLSKEQLQVTDLNDFYRQLKQQMQKSILAKNKWKQLKKQYKQSEKASKKQSEKSEKRYFVIDFNGDVRASRVKNLRQEISAILTMAQPTDEVVIRLESAGGMVQAYGLAASQVRRLRDHGIPVTVTVDKVAASGGYMMACVADKVLAAPFAIVGSVGVLAQMPNFNRWLKENHIDYEQITAGQYKRTLSLFGENTDEGRRKFQEEIEQTHQLFKQFVGQNRPQVDVEQIATGEYWHAWDAQRLKLVDTIDTSDNYLLAASEQAEIYHIDYALPRSKLEKLTQPVQQALAYFNLPVT